MLEVLAPGLLSTIQDAGRPEYTDLGVPEAGACDPWALAAANLLLGNPPSAAALEVTLAGPELRALATCVVALAGAGQELHIPEEGREIAPGTAHLVRGGSRLQFRAGGPGARMYLALVGGIAVPPVLGAAATYLPGGFGGLDGRPLRPGDRLIPAAPGDFRAAGRRWPDSAPIPAYGAGAPLRVLPGPDLPYFDPAALDTLRAAAWEVGAASDRMGLRLRGPAIPLAAPPRADLVSRGAVWGAMQVPPDGQPILLLADHQTVGGYPVLAVVIRADWPLLAQLPPGAPVRCQVVTIEEAQAAYRAQQAALHAAGAALAQSGLWDRLLAGTGG